MQTTLLVGKAHLQQSGNQTTSRDVVTSHHPAFLDEFLYSHKGIGKVFGILDGRHITAHLAQTLCEGGATQPLLVEREVDMVQRTAFVVLDNRAYHLADVAHLTTGTDDNRSRRDNFLAIRILLCQTE